MSIRTFFAQPFKIPTGSMQPTLFGVTTQDHRGDPAFVTPGLWKRAWEFALHGAIYRQATVEFSGDHLFVDRLTYNFRRPARGEIVVFKTRGIARIATDQFYIKRLIGLPGEIITIGADRHVRVNGVRLDASTPHFKNVYGFDTNLPPRENQYSGHILAPDFQDAQLKSSADQLKVRDKHYAVFGDNTKNSSDSRYWGDFPRENVIGRAWFVYWPYSSRFGITAWR
jgi:signal peptidase I